MNITFAIKKLKHKWSGGRSRKYIIKNMQAIDWISDSLISAGENFIKSSKTTNSYRHEKNSI